MRGVWLSKAQVIKGPGNPARHSGLIPRPAGGCKQSAGLALGACSVRDCAKHSMPRPGVTHTAPCGAHFPDGNRGPEKGGNWPQVTELQGHGGAWDQDDSEVWALNVGARLASGALARAVPGCQYTVCPEWRGLGSGGPSGKVDGRQVGKGPECQAKRLGIFQEDNEQLEVSEVSEQEGS